MAANVDEPAPARRQRTPSPRHRFLVLGVCCSSLFIVGLDVTIVNIALPSIRRDLHASVADLQWTVDAYTLVVASLLLLSGSMADRLGRARVFKVGLTVFTLGSLLCGLAPSVGVLVAARALQAVGGSMLNPVAMSIIRNTFTDPRERAQAIGIWGGVMGVSMALGPVLGGALVEGVSWRAIFWINVPVGLAAIALTARFVPESRAPRARRLDPVGQVLILVLLASLTYGIIEAPSAGWLSAQTLGCFAVTAVALAGLLSYEPRRAEPLIELRFFRSAPFSGASGIAVGAFFGMSAFLFLNTLYLQQGRGLSPLQAGLYLLPMAATTVVVAPLTGLIVGRFGPRPPLVGGGLAMAASGLMLTGLDPATAALWLFATYAVFGIGFGAINPPITNAAVSGMPADQAGVAAAIASTSRQVGASLGIAVIGAVAVHGSGSAAVPAPSGWWIIAGAGVFVSAVGFATTTRWALRTAAAVSGRRVRRTVAA
jgi:EmrB/QacA subfamily drug resistance transporter